MHLDLEEGQSNPPEQILTISNTGSETKTYTAAATQDWIVLNTTSVTVDLGSPGTIPVGVVATGLGVGTYDGQVTITDGTGAMVNIPVSLEIVMAVTYPVLSVSTAELVFTYKAGDIAPSPQTVTVDLANDDGTTIWTAEAEDAAWLSIVPSTGQGDSTTIVTISVDPTGLGIGDHMGTITISAPDADGSPATITVTLSILYGGALQVTCNIEEASFSIEGPEGATYEGSGKSWNESEVPDGTYTITYNQVLGYRTPSSETKELSGSETITFDGIYESLAVSSNIVACRAADHWNDAAIGIFDKEGAMLHSFTPFPDTVRRKDKACANTAIGDIDGDGNQDIVVGRGFSYSSPNAAEVAVHRANGTSIEGSSFTALSTKYG
ncbi:MAG: BACON domain-containing protein, partial [Candidatus Hermodarchaeia archaeon]